MKIEKLKVGQVVYSVERRKMGNTTLSTTSIFSVYIVSINLDGTPYVTASWNGNAAKRFYSRSISKWREKKPLVITGGMGFQRLATRAEIKEGKGK